MRAMTRDLDGKGSVEMADQRRMVEVVVQRSDRETRPETNAIVDACIVLRPKPSWRSDDILY